MQITAKGIMVTVGIMRNTHGNQELELETEVFIMEQIQTETRKTVCKKMSYQHGYTGVSVLHELHPLYGFDVMRHLVYDIHHNLRLNVIKNQVDRLKLNKLNNACNKFLGHLSLHLVVNHLDFTHAEDYMKFAFHASEAVLDGLLPDKEFEIWTNVARLTEMHSYSGQFGWSQEEISNSYKQCEVQYIG